MKSLLRGLSLLPLLLIACGTDGGNGSTVNGACATSSTGKLVVTVSGLPSGVNASVNFTTGGSTQTVTQTTTLDAFASGAYTVSADIVTQADPIVRTANKGTVSVTTAQVCDGETTNVDVTYAEIATSNKIWWGNENGANPTLAYSSSHLAASGSPAADVEAGTAGAIPGEFDAQGNLWVVDSVNEAIKRYSADSLAAGGSQSPDVEIDASEFTGGIPGPASMTFDAKGNLYVGIAFSKTIARFDNDGTLAATGVHGPTATITTPDAPNALAFDKDDNLWAACANDRVVKLGHAHETGSITATPDVSIEAKTPSPVINTLSNPLGLAFDAAGNLWVDYDGTFAALTASDRSGSGDVSITPAIQIQADVLSLPGVFSFDESGGLWFAYSQGKIAKFGASQLTASGSVTPEVIVTSSSVGSATGPALYPAPKALPLYAAVQK
ncbi:MAG: hypothetical protein ACRELY_30055 [Polyangiaceae bacterium]